MNGPIIDIEEIKLMIPYKTHANKNIYFISIVKLTKEKKWNTKSNDFIPRDIYMLTNCFITFSVDSIGFTKNAIT